MSKPLPRTHKKVKLRAQHDRVAEKIEYACSLSPLTSRILAARGFEPGGELENYLVPTLRKGLPNPSELMNLDRAVESIVQVIENKGGIAIACDFDVDGLSSGSLLLDFLKNAGAYARVYVPDRFAEGYGLNERIVREVKADGYDLLITVDYGTTNITELELARSLGLQTIVVDHHHVEKNPPADIFINPHQEGCGFSNGELSAAGLAWYLTLGLRKKFPDNPKLDPKNYLDLACLGTICDMVPLRGANRIIARRGLECLAKTARPGLIALKNVIGANGKVSCSNISFGIGPRINAAGRMLNGEIVIDLLTTDDTRKADKLAKKLHKLNKERQDTETRVKEAAFEQVLESDGVPDGIVAFGKDFHTGVIGIVAQRLVEQFYRPSAVLGYEKGMYKGSVRGIKGMSVVGLLASLGSYLENYGGHEGAGGFSIREEKVDEFISAFTTESEKLLSDIEREPTVQADTVCGLEELTPAIIEELKRFEPLGIGNPGPQLMLEKLEVKAIKLLKDAHIKATLSNGKHTISGMLWRTTEHPALVVGNSVTVVGKPDLNTFYGYTELQMNIQAVEATN